MKQSKKETTLCEKDALQDLLNAEKLLLSYYASAITEGSCKSFRKEIMRHYSECAETQFSVFEQMLTRGYYEVQPAKQEMIEEKAQNFAKIGKQLAVSG